MNRIRKQVACLAISIPCLVILPAMNAELFSSVLSPQGAIYGRVTYKGKPVDRGFVMFYSTDEKINDWAVGTLDKDGSYCINPGWRHCLGKTQYQISITPQRRRARRHVDHREVEAASHDVASSRDSQSADSHSPALADIGFPRRFTSVRTSGLKITLGTEPARIDIDMKD